MTRLARRSPPGGPAAPRAVRRIGGDGRRGGARCAVGGAIGAVLASLAALAPDTAFPRGVGLQVDVAALPPAGLPAVIEGELGAALALPGQAPDRVARFRVDGPTGPCECQAWTPGGGVTRLAWRPSVTGVHTIAFAREFAAAPHEAPPFAVREGDAIRIDNGALRAMHSPSRAGGFPVDVTVAGAASPLPIEYADRVYEPQAGQFFLPANPTADVRLVANGPLFATVEAEGGYMRSGAQPMEHASRPRARYRFTYFRDSPLVRVEVAVTQASAFAWKELHVLEIRATAAGLGKVVAGASNAAVRAVRWAGGDPPLASNVTHAGGAQVFSRWAALRFENGTAGIVHPHAVSGGDRQARIYDGPGLLYAMGPWVAFPEPRVEFERYLWFASAAVPDAEPAGIAARLDESRPLRAVSPQMEERVRAARKAIVASLDASGQGTARAVALRRLGRAASDLRALRNVAGAREVIEGPIPRASPGGAPPAPVECLPAEGGGRLLATADVLAELDARGRLVSLHHVSTDTEFLSGPCSMFRFTVRDAAGVETSMTAHEAALDRAVFTNGELRLRYSGQCGGVVPVRVTLTLRPDGPSLSWRAEGAVEGDGAACWRLDAPVLDGVGRAGGDEPGDAVLVPDGWGRLLPRPAAARYQGRYPGGSTTMQVLGLTRGGATLGLIARDGRCFAKDLVAAGSPDGRTLSLEMRHYPADMGATRSCAWPYDVETVVLPGDWYDLARRYRDWATRQAWCDGGRSRGRPDSPEWFRKLVWWHHDGARDGTRLTNTMARIRAAVPQPLALHWYNWHQIPFDNFYPDYFPANDYVPSVRAQMREWDVRVMPYINGHLWDPQSAGYTNDGGARWEMKKADGTRYIEHYAGHDHSIACPWTDAWRDTMVAVTDRLFREVGVDAVYLDQIGAAAAQLCHDASHGHPRGGGDHYVAGYWRILRAVRDNARRIRPDTALTTEDTAEPYIGLLDGTLMCNKALPDSVPFFPAVYHEHVTQFGLYIHEPEIRAGVTFRSKAAMLFQFGGQLGWHGTDWSEAPAHRAKFEWLAKLAAVRSAGLDWLAYGEMLRPPAVTMRGGAEVPQIAQEWIVYRRAMSTVQPAATASAWRAPDGRIAVFVINVSDDPLPVSVVLPPECVARTVAETDLAAAVAPPAPRVVGAALALDLPPQSVRMFVISH